MSDRAGESRTIRLDESRTDQRCPAIVFPSYEKIVNDKCSNRSTRKRSPRSPRDDRDSPGPRLRETQLGPRRGCEENKAEVLSCRLPTSDNFWLGRARRLTSSDTPPPDDNDAGPLQLRRHGPRRARARERLPPLRGALLPRPRARAPRVLVRRRRRSPAFVVRSRDDVWVTLFIPMARTRPARVDGRGRGRRARRRPIASRRPSLARPLRAFEFSAPRARARRPRVDAPMAGVNPLPSPSSPAAAPPARPAR